ncbi:MAG: ArsR family transcriptional regulator [Phycicoccus sp.]
MSGRHPASGSQQASSQEGLLLTFGSTASTYRNEENVAIDEVDLRVGQPDEMRVSVGSNPLLSVLTGVVETLGPRRRRLPGETMANVGRLARRLDLRPLRPIMVPSAWSAGFPHFIGQPSGPGFEPMSRALERLGDTPTDTIVEQIAWYESYAGSDNGLGTWLARPRHMLAAFVAALSDFERTVFRSLIPNLEVRLRTQVENLAIAVGTGSGPALLSAVHPHLTRVDDKLRWPSTAPFGLPKAREMVVYPMAASSAATLTSRDANGVTLRCIDLGLTMPALALHGRPHVAARGRVAPLAASLGPARATVLSAVATGTDTTTTTLSTDLRLPPSTVSRRLAELKNSGLVTATRTRSNVAYHTTIAGRRILTAWD